MISWKILCTPCKLRLDYDRGMILLANPEKTQLIYAAGYGLNEEQLATVKNIFFSFG